MDSGLEGRMTAGALSLRLGGIRDGFDKRRDESSGARVLARHRVELSALAQEISMLLLICFAIQAIINVALARACVLNTRSIGTVLKLIKTLNAEMEARAHARGY